MAGKLWEIEEFDADIEIGFEEEISDIFELYSIENYTDYFDMRDATGARSATASVFTLAHGC